MSRVIVFDEFGGPEVLHVVDAQAAEPAAGEVRVRIEAFAVNPLDLMMRSGAGLEPVPLPARLGIEGTGVVEAVGADVTDFGVGDAVILAAVRDPAANGSYAEHVTLPANRVIARPAGLEVTEAAAIWVGFSTAWGALVKKAGITAGQSVLVTAASGAVGRAAIQVARLVGAEPIAVTRHSAKADELREAGASAVIATDAEELRDGVLRHTGGTGADVVLDLVGGAGQAALAAAARPGAVLIRAGFLDAGSAPASAPGREFESYMSFRDTTDPETVGRMAAFLEQGLERGALRPRVGEVFAFDRVVDAHRHVESGAAAGKTVVTV